MVRDRKQKSTSTLNHETLNSSSTYAPSDISSISLLVLLYVLQGIPLGLAGSIPYLLQSRNISYADQATYSFVFWPFSLKLLWAPFVDSVYLRKVGRRKSWLVPIQYLIGIFMMILSSHVGELLGDDHISDVKPPVQILKLTAVFFSLNFLAATQDIAVDGWALTMLSRLVSVMDVEKRMHLTFIFHWPPILLKREFD